MPEGQEVSEEKLIAGESNAADNEREWEWDRVVERQRLVAGYVFLALPGASGRRCWCVSRQTRSICIHTLYIDHTHKPTGKADIIHNNSDVLFVGIFGRHGSWLSQNYIE
jgi:hypothetical protein